MATEWTVRFKGDNSSVLSKARQTEQTLGSVSTKVIGHNKAMARSAETTARVQGQALTSTRRHVDASSKSFRNAEREVSRFGRGALAGSGIMRGLGRSVAFASAAFLGTAGLINVVRVSIGRAVDLSGSILRTQIVFGRAAGEVRRWSRTTFQALGIARAQALSYANAFGTVLTALGLAPHQSAIAAQALTKIGAAISLGAGETDPGPAMQALTAGITGRGRALRTYGIILDNVTIKAEAMRLGLVKTSVDTAKVTLAQRRLNEAEAVLADTRSKHVANSVAVARAEDAVTAAHKNLEKATSGSNVQLSAQQKTQAALSIITRQSSKYTDNYGKLMNTAAGRQRRFHQGVKEIEEELGRGLLPVFNRGIIAANKWIKSVAEGGPKHEQFVKTMGRIRKILSDSIAVLKTTAHWAGAITRTVGGWEIAFKIILSLYLANKFLNLAAAIGKSRLALLAVGRTAPVVAGEVVTAETAMTAGATTFAGRLALVRLRLLALLGPIGLVAGALIGAKAAWDRFNPSGIASDVIVGANPYPAGSPNYELWKAGATGRRPGSRISRPGPYGGTVRASGPAFRAGRAYRRSHPGHQPGAASIAGAALGAAQSPGASGVGFSISGEASPHDCSAFTQAIYRGHGMKIPRTSQTQWASAPLKSKSKRGMKEGDLIFFTRGLGAPPGHVGIYIGGGMMVSDHGAHGGVSQTGIDWSNFWGWGRYETHPGDVAVTAPPGDTSAGTPLVVDHPTHHRSTRTQVAALRQTLGFISSHLDQVLSPQLQARIRARVRSITKILTGVVTPAELVAANKQMTALKTLWSRSLDFSQGVKNVRVAMGRISKQIERMPAEARGRLRNQMATLRAELENVTTQAGLARIRKKLSAISKAIEAAIAAATAKAEAAQSKLDDILGSVFDKAMETFDAQTEKMVALARAPLDAIAARRAELDLGARKEDAQTKLARAQRLGDPQLLREALQELSAIELDEQEKAAQEQADAEEKRIRDERRLVKERFEKRWKAIIEGNTVEGHLTQKGIDELIGLIGEYGIDFASAGDLIGQAFAQGFRDAIGDLIDAIGELIDSLNDVARATGRPLIRKPDKRAGGIGHVVGGHGGREMAEGGILMRPTRVLAGEAGPEGFFPLNDPRTAALLRDALGGGGGDRHYHLEIGTVIGNRFTDAARDIYREIKRIERADGDRGLIVRTSNSAKLGQRRQR